MARWRRESQIRVPETVSHRDSQQHFSNDLFVKLQTNLPSFTPQQHRAVTALHVREACHETTVYTAIDAHNRQDMRPLDYMHEDGEVRWSDANGGVVTA